jgi:hypothetical protein
MMFGLKMKGSFLKQREERMVFAKKIGSELTWVKKIAILLLLL